MTDTRRRRGLAARLLAAQALVALVGAVTVALVASAVGPAIFHAHLREVTGHVSTQASRHVEAAFTSASVVSITVALVASLAAALAVSAYVSRRIAGPVVRLAAAARDVAAGRYAVQVAAPALGGEFTELTDSFNAMAGRLGAVEATRRRLLADLAHEMRTPVATLDAYLEGLEDGVVTIDASTAAMLRAQTGRLIRLADDITAVSRAEENQLELHPRPVPAAELVRSATAAAADRYAAAGVSLTADVTAGLGDVSADPERVAQVLGNLLDNALRHTPAGGRVTVSARPSAGLPGGLDLTVTDTGEGIPAEHVAHVFERFYRVDRARDRAHGGSGIGLTIVKALTEAHGGSVSVASDGAGRGATFTVRLPAAPSGAA